MLDQAFKKLENYDWGVDPKELKPIDDAIVASHGDASARSELETRLASLLEHDVPRAAKDYICRKLKLIGTEASVPVLEGLLPNEELSHMARYALQTMPNAAAADALRSALDKVSGKLKIGMISSLGARQDEPSVSKLTELVADPDAAVAIAAAKALADIGSPKAADSLSNAKANPAAETAVADALLVCAERLVAEGQKAKAVVIYRRLSKSDQKHIKLAATRGMFAAAK